jgi:hypothetical protein
VIVIVTARMFVIVRIFVFVIMIMRMLVRGCKGV